MQIDSNRPLEQKRVLIVEDEFLLGLSLLEDLTDAGADVIGPVSTISEALQLLAAETFDLALLDINVRGEVSYPIAYALLDRRVPLIFLTGYEVDVLPERLQGLPRLGKPYDPRDLSGVVARVVQV